jgi:hypothetical protein
MAITQERMISLINAASDYRNAILNILRWFEEDRERGQLTGQQYESRINALIFDVIQLKGKHDAVISTEYQRFASRSDYNTRQKIKMEAKRREAGITPKPNAPNILGTTDQVYPRNIAQLPTRNQSQTIIMTPTGTGLMIEDRDESEKLVAQNPDLQNVMQQLNAQIKWTDNLNNPRETAEQRDRQLAQQAVEKRKNPSPMSIEEMNREDNDEEQYDDEDC